MRGTGKCGLTRGEIVTGSIAIQSIHLRIPSAKTRLGWLATLRSEVDAVERHFVSLNMRDQNRKKIQKKKRDGDAGFWSACGW